MSQFSGKFLGIDNALLPNCEWNQKQKLKKQPWSNVECFAFGVGTVRFESTEKVGRGAILPFLQIIYGHSQLSIIGGECFFVAGGWGAGVSW